MAKPETRWVALGGSALILFLCIQSAWMSDDAFITLRSVDNIVNGFGPRWNVAERVQAFTHPAWLMLITPLYAVTREPYFTVLALQMVLSVLAVAVCCLSLARHPWHAAIGVATLAGSKAFVDFSTSGLENPLSHVLLVLFLLAWRRHLDGGLRPAMLGFITSALLLCRLDMGVLIAPMLALAIWRHMSRRDVVAFALALSPFVAWEAFSFVYYGMLVPNTALAKLPPGVPESTLIEQGVRYFFATWYFDPFTLVMLAASCIVLVWAGGRGRIVAAGIALHCVYVVSVGGDFMMGRFLTPALVCGVAGAMALVSRPIAPRMAGMLAATLIVGGLLNPDAPLRTGSHFGGAFVDRDGVTDERRYYYPTLGLLPVLEGRATPANHGWAAFGLRVRAEAQGPNYVREASNIGLFGYYAGPNVYIIDRNALSEPFLARLPPKPDWRIGHYEREVPSEYVASRREDRNVITDMRLHELYDRVNRITRGPVWDASRLRELLVSKTP
jgi:arabinofuranosyltransferase